MVCQHQFRPILKIFLTNALTLSLLLQMKALRSQDVTTSTSCSSSPRYIVGACWTQVPFSQNEISHSKLLRVLINH